MRIENKLFLALLLLFIFPPLLLAGGGAFQTFPDSGTHVVGDQVGVAIRFLESDNVTPRSNNNVEIRVENPKDGDKCYMTAPITNSEGMAYGKCTSAAAGSIIVYPYWIEGSQNGSGAIIYFVGSKPTTPPTLVPTKVPSVQPSQKPTNSVTEAPTTGVSTELSPTQKPLAPDATTPPKKENIFVRFWKFIRRLLGLSG